MIINNPHVFYYEIKDSQTEAVTYTIPYCIENGPSVDDGDDIVSHLVKSIKERLHVLGWNHPDLYYRIGYHSPLPSGMDMDLLFGINMKVRNILDGKE